MGDRVITFNCDEEVNIRPMGNLELIGAMFTLCNYAQAYEGEVGDGHTTYEDIDNYTYYDQVTMKLELTETVIVLDDEEQEMIVDCVFAREGNTTDLWGYANSNSTGEMLLIRF